MFIAIITKKAVSLLWKVPEHAHQGFLLNKKRPIMRMKRLKSVKGGGTDACPPQYVSVKEL